MQKWIVQFQRASTDDVGPGHSQTLPLRGSSDERKDEQKRRSLFAMKKK